MGDSVVSDLGKDQVPLTKHSHRYTYINSKIVEVPDARSTSCIQADRVENDEGVMSASIVGVAIRVCVVEATVTISGHVLLIFTPTNALLIQEVHDSRDVARDIYQIIVVQSKEVTSRSAEIIGLARVCQTIVTGESDTLLREVLEDLLGCSCVVVGVVEPDLDETIENGTRNQRGILNGSVRRTDIEGRCISGTDRLSYKLTVENTKAGYYARGSWCSKRGRDCCRGGFDECAKGKNSRSRRVPHRQTFSPRGRSKGNRPVENPTWRIYATETRLQDLLDLQGGHLILSLSAWCRWVPFRGSHSFS